MRKQRWRICKEVPGLSRVKLRRVIQHYIADGIIADEPGIFIATTCLFYYARRLGPERVVLWACFFIACKLFDDATPCGNHFGHVADLLGAEKKIFQFFHWRLPIVEMGLVYE